MPLRRLVGSSLLLAALLAPDAVRAGGHIERLSSDVRPSFQTVSLDLDPAQKEFTGSVRVELAVGREQEALRFHAREMTLTRARLEGRAGRLDLETVEGPDGTVRASRDDGAPIAPGAYTLEIDFTNDFDERATSIYRLQVDGTWYAFSQFQAVDARGAFPCFDEPGIKIPYQMTITAPADLAVVTNTPVERESLKDGRRTTVFARTKPLPSYLLAVAVGPLEFTPVPGTSIPTRVVTVKGKRHLTGPAVATTPPLLAALERYFGRRYPFEKLDLIAVPEYTYGAMENPGAITYTDQALLFDSKTISVDQRRTLLRFTAHELAHMWFGDLVTMQWWDDLWLNESFAEWMGDKIVSEAYPEFETDVSGLRDLEKAFEADARLTARTIRQPVSSTGNLLQIADALTYQKGQAVLGMLEQWLGPETFRKGIRRYLKRHEWGNAVEADLWRALSEASGRDVGAVGAAFFGQPGIPLVRVEPLGGPRVRLRQSRFLSHGLRDSVARRWRIPVRFKYPTPEGVRTWSTVLESAEAEVSLPGLREAPAWLHPNAEETGYYRWALAGDGAQRLATESARVLGPRERYGFLLNAFALLKGGELAGVDYMKLLLAFGADSHPAVVDAVTDGMQAVHAYFVSDDVKPPFAAYVRRALGPALDRIGLEPKPGESPAAAALRASLFEALADWGRESSLRGYAREATGRYLRGEEVEASLIGSALRVAAMDGDAALFEALRTRFESGAVPSERGRLLAAIGSFRDPELRARALAYNLSGPLKPQEHYKIVQAISAVPEQQDELWEWARTHYAAVVSKLPPFLTIYYPWLASGCSPERLESARTFFAETDHSPPGTEAELRKMDASVLECIGLREREGPAVRDYLVKEFSTP